MATFQGGVTDTGITAIDAALVQEAGRIGADIHKRTLHTSAWMDLIKQSPFPEGMGYTQQTMIYDRALPTTGTDGNSAGVNWHDIAITETSSSSFLEPLISSLVTMVVMLQVLQQTLLKISVHTSTSAVS